MKPIAGIQILLFPNGELQCEGKGLTRERFRAMVVDAIAIMSAKLAEQEEKQPQIQVPSPAFAAKLGAGIPHH